MHKFVLLVVVNGLVLELDGQKKEKSFQMKLLRKYLSKIGVSVKSLWLPVIENNSNCLRIYIGIEGHGWVPGGRSAASPWKGIKVVPVSRKVLLLQLCFLLQVHVVTQFSKVFVRLPIAC